MSLINQMLQDLEQRNASVGKTEPISGEVRAVPIANQTRAIGAVMLILLLSIFIAGAWIYFTKYRSIPVASVESPVKGATGVPAPAVQVTPQPKVAVNILPDEAAPKVTEQTKSVTSNTQTFPSQSKVIPSSTKLTADEAPVKSIENQQLIATPAHMERNQPQDLYPRVKASPRLEMTNSLATTKIVSAAQQSDNFYRQSVTLLQQGRVAEAIDMLDQSLELNASNIKSRQALAGLMTEAKRTDEAIKLLVEGLKLYPKQTDFSMNLARLQVEADNVKGARDTLETGLQYAEDSADYHAFYAALLQRDQQHEEAVQHYLVALKSNPAMPTWLVGIGISLQAQGKLSDATAAYQRARDTGQLSTQLAQFVEQRLAQIKATAP